MTNSAKKPSGYRGSKAHLIAVYHDLVGTVPDAEIAAKCGVHKNTVTQYRAIHKIPPCVKRTKRRSKIDPFADLVGKVSDPEVAIKAGSTVHAVRNWRIRHGVPKFVQVRSPQEKEKKKFTPRSQVRRPLEKKNFTPRSRGSVECLISPYRDLLGKTPDAEIARMADVTPAAVRYWRIRSGIHSVRRQRRESVE